MNGLLEGTYPLYLRWVSSFLLKLGTIANILDTCPNGSMLSNLVNVINSQEGLISQPYLEQLGLKPANQRSFRIFMFRVLNKILFDCFYPCSYNAVSRQTNKGSK